MILNVSPLESNEKDLSPTTGLGSLWKDLSPYSFHSKSTLERSSGQSTPFKLIYIIWNDYKAKIKEFKAQIDSLTCEMISLNDVECLKSNRNWYPSIYKSEIVTKL